MTSQCIPTFIINSKDRMNFKENSLKEFNGKEEFAVNFVEPVTGENKISDLWKTIQQIVQKVISTSADYILICKDSHQFTANYSKDNLLECIRQAKKLDADILCGEVNSFGSAIRVSNNIFWVENFSESQFTIIFRSFFENILLANKNIFSITNGQFFIYPFISNLKVPKGAGLKSDNNEVGVKQPSFSVSEQVELIERVSAFYKSFSIENADALNEENYDNIVIPTYIINLPERTERLEHIKGQFAGKDEFNIQIIEACKNPIGAVGLWETIRKIIKLAIENKDDVIIICEDDHEFTPDYSRSFLLKNIMEAYLQQAEMLLGGVCGLIKALPISDNRAWISYSHCTQFTILYKPVFQKILDEPYNNKVVADILLSKMVINKMVIFPFISVQKYFGYSDVSQGNNDDKEMLNRNFSMANRQLKRIFDAKTTFPDS
jgi:methylmalonyl-CoA mutase cobalamin-binding subunit